MKVLVVLPTLLLKLEVVFVKIVLVLEKVISSFSADSVFVTVCVRIVVHGSLFIFFLLFCCFCAGKVLSGFSAEFGSISFCKSLVLYFSDFSFFCLELLSF